MVSAMLLSRLPLKLLEKFRCASTEQTAFRTLSSTHATRTRSAVWPSARMVALWRPPVRRVHWSVFTKLLRTKLRWYASCAVEHLMPLCNRLHFPLTTPNCVAHLTAGPCMFFVQWSRKELLKKSKKIRFQLSNSFQGWTSTSTLSILSPSLIWAARLL